MERFRLPLVDSLSHAGMDVHSKRLSATTFSPTRWTNAGAAFSLLESLSISRTEPPRTRTKRDVATRNRLPRHRQINFSSSFATVIATYVIRESLEVQSVTRSKIRNKYVCEPCTF